MPTISPNMGLPISTIGQDSGLTWETNLNAAESIIDQHNHSNGQGVRISPNGLNINADLPFNSNNATLLRSARFVSQNAVLSLGTDIGCLYVVGNELYYNDVTGGNHVQITSNGSVAVTSSGISSGTASASFSAGVLVVKSTSTSGANILMQSAVLTNAGNLTNQLTVQAPSLSGSYSLTLPSLPGSQSFMTLDASGNIVPYASINQGITNANIAPLTYQTSSSSGTFTTTSGTDVTITNQSVTITTNGRPVLITMQSDGSGLGALAENLTGVGTINLYRDGTIISSSMFPGWGAPQISFLDPAPSAASHTYVFKANATSGITRVSLMATTAMQLQ